MHLMRYPDSCWDQNKYRKRGLPNLLVKLKTGAMRKYGLQTYWNVDIFI